MSVVPEFSIITVCLNEAEIIRETCESICSQTLDAFEWIVIDGGSTDGTLDILAEYESLIRCMVSEPDGGIYNAMNKGVERASGEYLIFLNAGDSLANEQVLDLVNQAPQKDIIFGDMRFVRADGSFSKTGYPDVLPRYFLLKNMMPHQASFIRRELFEKHGGYDEAFQIAGDYDLFVRLLYVHHVSYFRIPEVLSNFKVGGVSNQPANRYLRKSENHRVRMKHFPWFVYWMKAVKIEVRYKFKLYRFFLLPTIYHKPIRG